MGLPRRHCGAGGQHCLRGDLEPPSNISSGFWASAFGLCSGLAAVVSLCSAVVCVLFFMALNAGPQDGARFFIDYFLLLLPLPILLLVVGQHTSNGGNDNLQ